MRGKHSLLSPGTIAWTTFNPLFLIINMNTF
jgi:hypothetical protein